MLTCKECGKRFKDKNALGGHVSGFHRRKAKDEPQGQAVQEATPPAEKTEEWSQPVAATPDEEDKADSIRKLLADGYSPRQIKEQFGYARHTVDQVARRFIAPENAGGGESTGEGKHELMKLGKSDTVAPESVVNNLLLPRDGETAAVWKEGYLSCLYQVVGVARLLQQLSAAQAEVGKDLNLYRETGKS